MSAALLDVDSERWGFAGTRAQPEIEMVSSAAAAHIKHMLPTEYETKNSQRNAWDK